MPVREERSRAALWIVAAAVALTSAEAQAQAAGAQAQLAKAKTDLSKYQDPVVAIHDGYLSTLVCIDFPSGGARVDPMAHQAGGMGVHFLNLGLVGPTLDPARPQVLIYEPVGDKLRLAAAEWFVPVSVSKQPPAILGRSLEGPMEGHTPIMPAELHHWDLHVWLWKENPAGMFSPTNPELKCPKTGYTFSDSAGIKMVHPQ